MATQYFSPADFANRVSRPAKAASAIPGTMNSIMGLPRAAQGEYEVSDREARIIRSRIYECNKEHPRGYKFRTLREGNLLLVWRIK
jgi:hypothetical protein